MHKKSIKALGSSIYSRLCDEEALFSASFVPANVNQCLKIWFPPLTLGRRF
jgi:hypothetical protein